MTHLNYVGTPSGVDLVPFGEDVVIPGLGLPSPYYSHGRLLEATAPGGLRSECICSTSRYKNICLVDQARS